MGRVSSLLRGVLRLAGLLAALTLFVSAVAPAQDRPSIVLILADDLGYADLGCQGSRDYETPAVDRLAAEGLRFTAGYANAPNCAPTRACLLSGRDVTEHGIWTVGSGARGKAGNRRSVPPDNRTTLPADTVTLAECLRARSYRCGFVGKWHLGEPGTTGPLEQGFEFNAGGHHAGHPKSYSSPYRNPALVDGPRGEYLTDRLTDEALGFLDGIAEDEQFFLLLAHYTVHTPIQPAAADLAACEGLEPDGGQCHPAYAAMVRSLDRSVARLLAHLEELDRTDSTLVVFTSDNGGVGGYDGLQAREWTDNRPLRGGKGMLTEGGIRVPWIVRWPGVTRPGSVSDVPIVTYDLFPTFLALAGEPLDPLHRDPRTDGVDLAPLLRDEPLAERDLVWHFPGYLEANASAGTWRTTPAAAIRRGRHKLIEDLETGAAELFDLDADVAETTDLAAKDPERTAELLGALRGWRERRSAPMPTTKE